ncbi:hypothetical protein [Flavobacterium sp. UMI-01]|uniref:hypothetical protein n=1 Tax=Flavobacterium sp. UMI-01 TaxID=1441053 RepID=UPI001C7D1196|nr:hypothetical protein [Flavobacterium sp. UMI-01]GIZ10266.1 hypothetical protein FUMI01_29900 [Flavobacterium sp. UMI-01]
MTFVDLIKDFIDTSKERLKTPISGAFLWAFIIWNWRPIVVLLFSKQTIEDRIQIIDQYFCTLSALLWPIGLALFYTLAIPAIMIGIDWVLAPIKKIRIGRIYQSKDFVTDEKIKLARKEFELKNIETGNKQIEDFQKQINELEASKIAMEENHKTKLESFEEIKKFDDSVIESLNKKLKESNDMIKTIVKSELEDLDSNEKLNKTIAKKRDINGYINDILIPKFSLRERTEIKMIRDNEKLNFIDLSEDIKMKMFDLELIINKNGEILLTSLGMNFIKYL